MAQARNTDDPFAGVRVGMGIDLVLAVFVLVGRAFSASSGLGELVGGLALAGAYASPSFLALVGMRGRPAAFVAAGLLAAALSVTSFSLVTLVLLPSSALFLAATFGPRSRAGRRLGVALALAVAAALAAALVTGSVSVLWALPAGLVITGVALLAWETARAGSLFRGGATIVGVAVPVALAAGAWILPILDTTTVCWTTGGGYAFATTEPAPGGGERSVASGGGPPGSSSGCDSGVARPEASVGSLALLTGAVVVAAVAVPRVTREEEG